MVTSAIQGAGDMILVMRNLLIAFVLTAAAHSQTLNPALLERPWPAWWIAHPTASATEFGVYHFRKAFTLAEKPIHLFIHVSADNRYRLFVNGRSVSTGPAQSDLQNWRFETVDVAPDLVAGNNVVAAVVWNGGLEGRPMAQISHRTGFLLQADDPANKQVNTDKTWKVLEDSAYEQILYKDNDPRFRWNYYVAGATERVDAAKYPWGWEKPGFDDSTWLSASQIDPGCPAGIESHQRWQLRPRSVPFLTEDPQRFERVARTEGVEVAQTFLKGSAPIRIPANSKISLLLDQGTLTTGYPVLRIGGGRGAQVHVVYSESLYDSKDVKGDRNRIEGKHVMGPEDDFLPDGAKREYRPLWTRNWRWVQLDVQTGRCRQFALPEPCSGPWSLEFTMEGHVLITSCCGRICRLDPQFRGEPILDSHAIVRNRTDKRNRLVGYRPPP